MINCTKWIQLWPSAEHYQHHRSPILPPWNIKLLLNLTLESLKMGRLHLNDIKPIVKVLVKRMDNIKTPIVNEVLSFLRAFYGALLSSNNMRNHQLLLPPNYSLPPFFFTPWKFCENTGVEKEYKGLCHLCHELFWLFYFLSF